MDHGGARKARGTHRVILTRRLHVTFARAPFEVIFALVAQAMSHDTAPSATGIGTTPERLLVLHYCLQSARIVGVTAVGRRRCGPSPLIQAVRHGRDIAGAVRDTSSAGVFGSALTGPLKFG